MVEKNSRESENLKHRLSTHRKRKLTEKVDESKNNRKEQNESRKQDLPSNTKGEVNKKKDNAKLQGKSTIHKKNSQEKQSKDPDEQSKYFDNKSPLGEDSPLQKFKRNAKSMNKIKHTIKERVDDRSKSVVQITGDEINPPKESRPLLLSNHSEDSIQAILALFEQKSSLNDYSELNQGTSFMSGTVNKTKPARGAAKGKKTNNTKKELVSLSENEDSSDSDSGDWEEVAGKLHTRISLS